MQPSLIVSTARTANLVMNERGHGCPEALLLAWVAWEGLRIRILVVALTMHGWQVKDIYPVLVKTRLSTESYRKALNATLGCSPLQIKSAAESWRLIESHRKLRNKFVHGMGGSLPARLEAVTHLITDHVEDPSWLAAIPVHIDAETFRLGDPYRRLHPVRRKGKSQATLREFLLPEVK